MTDAFGPVITWPVVVYATERVRCAHCKACWRVRGHDECVYGGPFKFEDMRDEKRDN